MFYLIRLILAITLAISIRFQAFSMHLGIFLEMMLAKTLITCKILDTDPVIRRSLLYHVDAFKTEL